jgi:hypothetical protein
MAWKRSEEGELEERSKVAGVGCKRRNERVVEWKGFFRERKRRRASTSSGDAGSQAAACPHARRRRCAGGGRAGQGAEVHIGYCSRPYPPPFLYFVKFDQNLNYTPKSVKTKVVQNF